MANLDKAKRDALPDTDFAVPGKRKLPMHDKDHARLAWDMVDRAQGLTDEERHSARQRIIRRAHDLGIETKDWQLKASIAFEAMALQVPQVDGHPNRMPFRGVLTRLDQPSDAPPGGASGKRVYLSSSVAEDALPSLLGMGVDYTEGFDGHNRQQKIGLITGADIVGDAIEIEGFFYAKDFPEECQRIRAEKDALGFSFEVDVRIQDANADIWVIDQCVFTGAAVLYKHLAAYTTTSLAAKAEQEQQEMDEQLKKLLEAMGKLTTSVESIAAAQAKQGEAIAKLEAGKGASLAGPIVDQVRPHVDACNALAASMEAAGIGDDPRAGHVGVIRRVGAHMAAAAVSGRLPKIFRDHDYLPGASVEAGGGAAKIDAKAITDAVAAAVKPLQDTIDAQATTIKDLQAKAFKEVPAAHRATLSPEIKTLLAKGGIGEADMKDGKLSVDQVNKVLDAGGIKGHKAIELKLKLRHEGLMPAGAAH